MYHPLLLVFDGESDQLVAAVLRPRATPTPARWRRGDRAQARGRKAQTEKWPSAWRWRRSTRRWASRCPPTSTSGAKRGRRLHYRARRPQSSTPPSDRRAPAGAGRARVGRGAGGREGQAGSGHPLPRAGSWDRSRRRVVYKTEAMEKGTNTRCLVVTSGQNDGPKELYDRYVIGGAKPRGG